LLISTQNPHKGVSKETIAQWVKRIITNTGIDSAFTLHSTRAVATSTAKLNGVSLDKIPKTAGWFNVRHSKDFMANQCKN
jgi:hypothetical protein